MQIKEFLVRYETVAPARLHRRTPSWRKALIAAVLLASALGIVFAQWFGAEDAFLPSPV
jgi:hypothetical protein